MRDMSLIKNQLMVQSIKRWHIIPTVENQTVADHSFGVAMIARKIHNIIRVELNKVEWATSNPDFMNPYKVLISALEHDFNEVGRGDKPSRDSSVEDYLGKFKKLSTLDRIVRIADFIEAAFALERLSSTAHGSHVRANIINKITTLSNHLLDSRRTSVEIGNSSLDGINGNIADQIAHMFHEPWDYSVED